jgi:deoxyribodipyrimidine photo-lyase
MAKQFKRSLHIFRRDLRIQDNSALNAALSSSDEVFTCFIFNETQIKPHRYRSTNGLAFMIESLEELAREISLNNGELLFLYGDPVEATKQLVRLLSLDAVFVNKDYSPYSRQRDRKLAECCAGEGVTFSPHADLLLTDPEIFGKDDGQPYTVFTPFYKKASKLPVPRPFTESLSALRTTEKATIKKAASAGISIVDPRDFYPHETAPLRISKGGRSLGLQRLTRAAALTDYDKERDLPGMQGTSILAPHNKFGTLSPREVYHTIAATLGAGHTLIREVYWRDFFTHIAWHFPHVFGHAFHRSYDSLEWSTNEEHFRAWCSGKTGFPIVDAGMRELVQTGFMHNRVRMIVASFLVKDLHISWQRGEEFFAQHLTDYDPCVNNGSWQWAASTGCDAQPYFRIFNPWLQQKRFDPECIYIKKWLPELAGLAPKAIHEIADGDLFHPSSYPRPIVEHAVQKVYAEQMFKR